MQNGDEIVSISFVHWRDPNYMTRRENKELENRNVFTLNLSTSSMRAVLPEVTQVWKKEGATLDRKVMVRTIIIVIVSARGAKTPSIMVWSP